MDLDERQLNVVENLVRDLAAEVDTMPTGKAADRCEAVSIILDAIGLPEAAEGMRAAACRISEGTIAYREVITTLEMHLCAK